LGPVGDIEYQKYGIVIFNGRSSGSNRWRYVSTVPYFWPYEFWGYPLKFRPEK